MPDPFDRLLGSTRGLPVPSPLLGSGDAAELELRRLQAELIVGRREEVEQTLIEYAVELTPELPPFQDDSADDDAAAATWFSFHERLLTPAGRLAKGRPLSRVEQLLCSYVQAVDEPSSVSEPYAETLRWFSDGLIAYPKGILNEAHYQHQLHRWLTSARLDGNWEYGRRTTTTWHEAIGLAMANLTAKEGRERVLPRVLGQETCDELVGWLRGTNGIDDWLGLIPFYHWCETYSNAIMLGCEKSDVESRRAEARNELYEWLAGYPDALYG